MSFCMSKRNSMTPEKERALSKRIHMDFHTPDIAWERAMKDFDARRYVKILRDAHVNSLVSFTKCHHGYSYYNTELGLRHPSLPENLDLFGEILKEAHKNDMKVMAYYSVGWLSTVQNLHPEWMERGLHGEMLDTLGAPKTGPWANICLNSPYVTEVVLPELREIISQYDADGLWLDIIECNPCHCSFCQEKYRKQFGREMPQNNEDLRDFVVQTKYDFIHTCRELLESLKPQWAFTYNTAGRDRALVDEVDFCSIETHPGTPGDKDAWTRALLTYKFLQKYRKPWESCTSRFIHGWGGWDDQPVENMLAVGARILAHGGMINLGDQAYPNGTLDEELYKKIGQYFEFISAREPMARGGSPVPYVGVLTKPFDVYAARNDAYFGAVKILTQNHAAFDILDETMTQDFSDYACLVLPELGELKEETIEALRAYVFSGGTLLATGSTSLQNGRFQLASVLGCDFRRQSPYSITYLKVKDAIGEGIRRSPIMIPGPLLEVEMTDHAESLAEAYHPVMEPDYEHFMIFRNRYFSPPAERADTAGIVEHTYGSGRAVYVAASVFGAFQSEEQWYLCDVIGNILKRLIQDQRIVLKAPRTTELNVTQKENHVVCHLIQYQTQNEACNVREIVPAYDLELKVSRKLVAAQPPVQMPSGRKLAATITEDAVIVKIPNVDIYEQIVFEKA